jgi:ribosomal protein L17
MKVFNGKTVPLYYLRMNAEKRKQLIQGLFQDLILKERIQTTYAKAKYLSFWVEEVCKIEYDS